MTKKPTVYIDKKTEQYPLWLAEMKYDNTKSLRENYIDNALKPYSQNGTVYTLAQQQQRLELEESKNRDLKAKKKAVVIISERSAKNRISFAFTSSILTCALFPLKGFFSQEIKHKTDMGKVIKSK